MSKHASKAEKFVENESRADWHDKALWFVREKRDKVVYPIAEWEELRDQASQIKSHALSKLGDYLEEFERNAINNGVEVHWAKDGESHNKIVLEILEAHRISHMVKSKSMLTEECGLNHYLEDNGIEIIDTDLGEYIVQLKEETPSHIVMPAIHIKKEEVGELFVEKEIIEEHSVDPEFLTHAARIRLRKEFKRSRAALTGVNFAVAETGEVVVCTNEGNADMGVHDADVSIHSMGIEKIIPKRKHLGVFLRLLARSATGQDITVYTSHHKRPEKGTKKHIILVDNGRSERLKKDDFWSALKCIRCGACMNTCPIYRRSGGHSYGFTIPGPLGSILAPNTDLEKHSDLPFASTLCGSCSDVCPVKIDIHNQLYKWRQVINAKVSVGVLKKVMIGVGSYVLARPKLYRFATNVAKYVPSFIMNNKLNTWSIGRKSPVFEKESFKDWLKKEK